MPSGRTTAFASTSPPSSTSCAVRAPDAVSAARASAAVLSGLPESVPPSANQSAPNTIATTDAAAATHCQRRGVRARARTFGTRRGGGGAVGANRLLDHGLQPLPDARRRWATGVGEIRRAVLQTADFRAGIGIAGEILVDLPALVVVDGVDGVRGQEVLDFLGAQLAIHDSSIPRSSSCLRSRISPVRIRLFTVPSGCWSIRATSRYV